MVSKASLETLARTMSIAIIALVVVTIGKAQVEPASAAKPEIFSKQAAEIQQKSKIVPASKQKAPKDLKARGVWLKALLKEAGFKGKHLQEAWAVAMKESCGNPRSYNGDKATGDHSYGLFQINMIGNLGPERRKLFGLKSNDELFNPLTNAKAAYYMSHGGDDWSSWDIDKRGYNGGVSRSRYQKWLTQYPKG